MAACCCGVRPQRRAFIEEASQPALRLVTRIVIGLVEPERGTGEIGDDVAEADLTDGRLARLNGSKHEDQAQMGIDQCLKRLFELGRVVRAEPARHRRIRDGMDVLLRPGPRWAAVRRFPGFAPDPFQIAHCLRGASKRYDSRYAWRIVNHDPPSPCTLAVDARPVSEFLHLPTHETARHRSQGRTVPLHGEVA